MAHSTIRMETRIYVTTPEGNIVEITDNRLRTDLEQLVSERQALGRRITILLHDNGVHAVADDEPTEIIIAP